MLLIFYLRNKSVDCNFIFFASGAWSPKIQNAFQYLQVALPEMYVVTAVQFQGRQGSDEFVREFFLEYSDDSKTWRRYTNQLGIPEVKIYLYH